MTHSSDGAGKINKTAQQAKPLNVMDINHVHFYVEDAQTWCDWCVQTLGFQAAHTLQAPHTQTAIAHSGAIRFVFSSPRTTDSPVADYLSKHPPGIGDVAFGVANLDAVIGRAIAQGARLSAPPQAHRVGPYQQRWAQITGWGSLKHTLVQQGEALGGGDWIWPGWPDLPLTVEAHSDQAVIEPQCMGLSGPGAGARAVAAVQSLASPVVTSRQTALSAIDHVVLNVAAGELHQAIAWYEAIFGLQRRQEFTIHTAYSALSSQVLIHPHGNVQMPINEPASASSQIQEFLDINRGPGIQHIALRTSDIVRATTYCRRQGLAFLQVPSTYYDQLQQRVGFQAAVMDWWAIARAEVLVDWPADSPDALLLQIFTQPIFPQPTFFFELIERRPYRVDQQIRQAEGFGEGNFQALFEAIEQEQRQRGSLL